MHVYVCVRMWCARVLGVVCDCVAYENQTHCNEPGLHFVTDKAIQGIVSATRWCSVSPFVFHVAHGYLYIGLWALWPTNYPSDWFFVVGDLFIISVGSVVSKKSGMGKDGVEGWRRDVVRGCVVCDIKEGRGEVTTCKQCIWEGRCFKFKHNMHTVTTPMCLHANTTFNTQYH